VKVLLLHAFPLDARMWDSARAAIEEAGYETVAPDLPGPEPDARMEAWGERVLGLVDGEFVPVGVSMGGYLAFELWRRAPERIRALVLANTRATPDTPEAREARDETIRVLGESGKAVFWSGLAAKLVARNASVEGLDRIVLEQPITGLVSALEALRDRPDSRPTLATILVPVLVIAGEEDELIPVSEAEAMAAELPNARLVRVPGAGHLTPLERPEEFNRMLVEFLNEIGR
jgi:pimeloyl-ACP methyl ester carboxylesterase